MGQGAAKLIKAYRDALGLHAVVIAATSPAGPVRIEAAEDPARRVKALAKSTGADVIPAAVFWATSAMGASMLAEACRAELEGCGVPSPRRGWFATDAARAADLVEAIAEKLGVSIEIAEVVERTAADAVKVIELQITGLQRTGGLRMINQAYKSYRAAAAATGSGAMSYTGYLFQRKLELVRTTAEAARQSDRLNFGMLPTEPSGCPIPNR
jgi:hypothetical protein